MAMLEKAKQQEEKPKGDESADKEPKAKKHKKHPAAPPASAGPEESGVDQQAQQDDSGGAEDQGDAGQDGGGPPGGAPEGDQGQDQPGDQSQPQQQGPQGGQQAATPIPNPQAPGAGDDTSGGEDTPDDQDQATGGTPGQDAPSPSGAPDAQGGPGAANLQQVPMTPAMKEEYQNLDKMLLQILYQQGGAEHILPSLFAQGPHKIKGAITMSVTLAREIFLKAKAPQQLTLPFARDVAAHVMQIGEQVKGIQYSDQEFVAIFGGVYEGMMRAFGVKKQQAQHMQNLIPRSQLSQHAAAYTAAHGHAQAAAQANGQQQHAPDMPQQGPPAQAAGPQGPQGAGPSQGMLSQAAGQSQPQEGGGEEPEQGEEQENG